jgi:GT2 family glycosyltransferase
VREAEPAVSVCILAGRGPEVLDRCLAGLAAQEDPPPFEVVVCADRDERILEVVHRRFPGATTGVVAGARPGAARNVIVERARGTWLLFLDDDVTVPPHHLRSLAAAAAANPEAGVIGGPQLTPRGSTSFQVVQGAVLSSLVAAGPVRRRYGPHPPGPADERYFTLCNLAVRRDVMVPFDPELRCAEENALLTELRRRGVAMHYEPRMAAFHERRPTWRSFAAQMRTYGHGRGQLARRRPATFRPAHGVPAALVVYLATLPLLAWWSPLWLAPAVAWLGAVAAGAVRVATTLRRPTVVPLAAGLVVTVHVGYGVGILGGLLRRRRPAAQPSHRWVEAPVP